MPVLQQSGGDDLDLAFDIETGLLPGLLNKAEASSVYTKIEADDRVGIWIGVRIL
jgi:hypothetical protein